MFVLDEIKNDVGGANCIVDLRIDRMMNNRIDRKLILFNETSPFVTPFGSAVS